MFKKFFYVLVCCFLSVAAQAEVSKNLVYQGGSYETDGKWLYTNSPNGRFIVLGCGNYVYSKITNVNVCTIKTNNFKIYDVYNKKLNTIDLSSIFKEQIKNFVFTFDDNSSLYLAELGENKSEVIEDDIIFEFAKPNVTQKILKIDLTTSKVTENIITEPSKLCTQIAYVPGNIICAMNTVLTETEFSFDLFYFDSNLKFEKSIPISKSSDMVSTPQLADKEAISDRSIAATKRLIITEQLGGGLITTPHSFNLDLKTGEVMMLPVLDQSKKVYKYEFVDSYNNLTIYDITWRTDFKGTEPIKYPKQFFILSDSSYIMVDQPMEWDATYYKILGVNEGEAYFGHFEDRNFILQAFSLVNGKQRTIYKMEYVKNEGSRGEVWDANSESFYIAKTTGEWSKNDSTLTRIDKNGNVLDVATMKGIDGTLYINPRSSNPVILGYGGDPLYSSIQVYSPVKRKFMLIDTIPFEVPIGNYETPIFSSNNGLVILSFAKGSKEFSIYHYEYK